MSAVQGMLLVGDLRQAPAIRAAHMTRPGHGFGVPRHVGQETGLRHGWGMLTVHMSTDKAAFAQEGDAALQQGLCGPTETDTRRGRGRTGRIARYRGSGDRLQIETGSGGGFGHAGLGRASDGSHTGQGPATTDTMMRFFPTRGSHA
ncbi:MAG: hypothetical protein FJX25_08850 [Alphaproteobacteria bacterium]|nr:hypothetical protein [Alphaproteobacteria bacterium]